MKLFDLESKTPSQQSVKVFESYFGKQIAVDTMSSKQARTMLSKVRGLIKEHRAQPSFHRSEQNPAYLKLVVMERALEARVKEATSQGTVAPGEEVDQSAVASGVRKIAGATGQGAQAAVLGKAIDTAAQGKTLNPQQRAALGQQLGGLQKALSDPSKAGRLQQMLKQATAEAAKSGRRLREASELQQAQVVLAAQDMVDQVQKMIEQVSAMQFKDLPALVDSIRNDLGMDQAQQFNADATAALSGLVQGLQGSKQQLESAQGVLTGQAPTVPGADQGMAAPAPAEPGADLEADLSIDANLPPEDEEEPKLPSAKTLGRARR